MSKGWLPVMYPLFQVESHTTWISNEDLIGDDLEKENAALVTKEGDFLSLKLIKIPPLPVNHFQKNKK